MSSRPIDVSLPARRRERRKRSILAWRRSMLLKTHAAKLTAKRKVCAKKKKTTSHHHHLICCLRPGCKVKEIKPKKYSLPPFAALSSSFSCLRMRRAAAAAAAEVLTSTTTRHLPPSSDELQDALSCISLSGHEEQKEKPDKCVNDEKAFKDTSASSHPKASIGSIMSKKILQHYRKTRDFFGRNEEDFVSWSPSLDTKQQRQQQPDELKVQVKAEPSILDDEDDEEEQEEDFLDFSVVKREQQQQQSVVFHSSEKTLFDDGGEFASKVRLYDEILRNGSNSSELQLSERAKEHLNGLLRLYNGGKGMAVEDPPLVRRGGGGGSGLVSPARSRSSVSSCDSLFPAGSFYFQPPQTAPEDLRIPSKRLDQADYQQSDCLNNNNTGFAAVEDNSRSNETSSTSSRDGHECQDCGKHYSTSSNLARHRQTHRSMEDKKAKKCPHCDKTYVSMPAFSMHIRTHVQGCKCPYCSKCFSRPWLLQGHIRTHTGEKPFTCNVCEKSFADKSNLRAHVQTHSNTKPYVCGRCNKAFALKSYLYKHEESSCMKFDSKKVKDRRKLPLLQQQQTGTTKTDELDLVQQHRQRMLIALAAVASSTAAAHSRPHFGEA